MCAHTTPPSSPLLAAIAKLLLPGRSNTAVKNFWHCRLKSGTGTNTNKCDWRLRCVTAKSGRAPRNTAVAQRSCCVHACPLLPLSVPHAAPNPYNRFIVGGHCLAWLLSEVAHEDRIYPVAMPAFPSTAPTGQVCRQRSPPVLN
jgi:hypothetical protein